VAGAMRCVLCASIDSLFCFQVGGRIKLRFWNDWCNWGSLYLTMSPHLTVKFHLTVSHYVNVVQF